MADRIESAHLQQGVRRLFGDQDAARILSEAQVAHDRREWREAAEAYAAFIDAGGREEDVLLARGDVQAEAGDLAGARATFARLRTLRGGDAVAAFRLGGLELRLQEPEAARAALRDAHRLADEAQVPPSIFPPVPEWMAPSDIDALASAGFPSDALALFVADARAPASLKALGAPISRPDGPRLITAVAIDGVARAGFASAVRALHEAERGPPGSAAVLVAVIGGDAAHATATALAQLPTVKSGKAYIVHDRVGEGGRRAVNLALALGAAWSADVRLILGEHAGAGPDLASLHRDDPMVGFVTAGGAEATTGYGPPHFAPVIEVRARVVTEAGLLDAVYERADAAVLDFMLRANRLGFSTVSAGAGDSRLPDADDLDGRILRQRHPGHRRASIAFARGPEAQARRLAHAIDGRRGTPALLLDLTSLGLRHDGTAEFAVRVAGELSRDPRLHLHLWCCEDVARFHGLSQLAPASPLTPLRAPLPAPFPIAFKPTQPLAWSQLHATWSAAPVSGFLMLDAISLDVEQLDLHDLRPLFRMALDGSELVGHLSRFTRDQLDRRFGPSRADAFIALPSTAADEYGVAASSAEKPSGVLVVGNHYGHKNIRATVDKLRARWPDLSLTVLGPVLADEPNVRWLQSGGIEPEVLRALYAGAEVVVFPSLYEGFGLPIMHALANGRPVAAIDSPAFRELAARTGFRANLHLFSSTRALVEGVEQVRSTPFGPSDPLIREQRWADTARAIADAALKAAATFRFDDLLRRTTLMDALRRGPDDAPIDL